MSPTVAIMAKKKSRGVPVPKPGRMRLGRPTGAGRIQARYVVAATREHREWMGEFLKHLGEVEVSDVIREALRRHAEAAGFRPPPKR
jgi:hypothetical protein